MPRSVSEEDDMNRVRDEHLAGHPLTTTVELSRLATQPRCKLDLSVIGLVDG
jgi:hypothetical protein